MAASLGWSAKEWAAKDLKFIGRAASSPFLGTVTTTEVLAERGQTKPYSRLLFPVPTRQRNGAQPVSFIYLYILIGISKITLYIPNFLYLKRKIHL